MKEINIIQIIGRHSPLLAANIEHNKENGPQIKAAIKEIVEEVLKLAAEKAELTEFASEFLQEGASDAIDFKSILNVAKLIKYE